MKEDKDRILEMVKVVASNSSGTFPPSNWSVSNVINVLGSLDIPLKTLVALQDATMVAVPAPEMAMACTLDCEIGETPEACVLDGGNVNDCDIAQMIKKPKDCRYWGAVPCGPVLPAQSLSPDGRKWFNEHLSTIEALAAGTWRAVPVDLFCDLPEWDCSDTSNTYWDKCLSLLAAAPEKPED